MKRIISFVTAVVICLGISVSFNTAAAETTNLSEEQICVLTLIGVVNENELTDETLASEVSRSQFLMYTARAIGVSENIVTENNYYEDMNGHWAKGLANYFVERGILTVGDSKNFEPDRTILTEEAIKIVLAVLGYNVVAEQVGGFPTGYVKTANRIGLNVPQINTGLTLDNALSILADGLEIDCYEPISFSNDGYVDYNSKADETILSLYHSIYTDEGYVRATNTVSLDGVACVEDEMVIGNYNYKANVGYIERYLGLNVKVYYSAENPQGERTAELVLDNNYDNVIDIDSTNIQSLDSAYKLSVWKADGLKTQRYSLERGVTVIKNGSVEATDIREVIAGLNYGYVRLVDADKNGLYEYCIIKDYIPFVLSYSYNEKGMIFDKLGSGGYTLEDYKYARIYDTAYNEMSIYDLTEDSVLSVAKSTKENEYIELICSSKVLSGTVEEMTERNGKKYVTINSTEYVVNPQFLLKNTINVGEFGSFKLDMFDTVVCFDESNGTGIKYGLLVGSVADGVFESSLKVKIFGADGQMYNFNAADKLTIDEKGYSDMGEAYKRLINSQTKLVDVQVIRYALNDEGKIKMIDTVAVGNDENANRTLRSATPIDDSQGSDGCRIYIGTTGKRIGMSTYINNATVCFAVPDEASLNSGNYSDDDFTVAAYSQMKEGRNIVANAYYSSSPAAVAEAIMVYGFEFGKGTDNAQDVFVVSSIYEQLDSDGDVKIVMEGFDGNTAKKSTYTVADNVAANVAEGDALLLKVNNNGEVGAITMIYDNSQGGEPNVQTGSTWYNKNRYVNNVRSLLGVQWSFSFMYAGYKEGDFVSGFYDKGGSYEANDEAADLTYSKVLVVDNDANDGDKVRIGDVGDIRDAYTVGKENCSRLLVNYVAAYMRCVVVYL